MKLAVLTPTVSRNAGGLFQSVRYLHSNVSANISTKVYSFRDEYTYADLPAWKDMLIETYPYIGPAALKYSPTMGRALLRNSPDLVHVHGLWYGTSIASSRFHRVSGHPYLISPRGMLDVWALKQSQLKKRLAGYLFEHSHLVKAKCLHALCQSELESMRNFGMKHPVAVVPNGVELPENPSTGILESSGPKSLLFIGRLHKKKGLPNALRAWLETKQKQQQDNWRFIVAGWDQLGHQDELKQLCEEIGILHSFPTLADYLENPNSFPASSVLFLGPAFDSQKDQLLRNADAFILPSFSEGMPMSVLEAWAYGLPVLMTDHCNLPEGFTTNAALRIGTDVESIAEGMRLLFASPASDWISLGENGRRLVRERFTWERVAAEMEGVYQWVLGDGEKPNSIVK